VSWLDLDGFDRLFAVWDVDVTTNVALIERQTSPSLGRLLALYISEERHHAQHSGTQKSQRRRHDKRCMAASSYPLQSVLRALCTAVVLSERRSASRWHDDGSTKIRLCTVSCHLPLSHVPEKVTGVVAQ